MMLCLDDEGHEVALVTVLLRHFDVVVHRPGSGPSPSRAGAACPGTPRPHAPGRWCRPSAPLCWSPGPCGVVTSTLTTRRPAPRTGVAIGERLHVRGGRPVPQFVSSSLSRCRAAMVSSALPTLGSSVAWTPVISPACIGACSTVRAGAPPRASPPRGLARWGRGSARRTGCAGDRRGRSSCISTAPAA